MSKLLASFSLLSVYIDIGRGSSDSATLNFAFANTASTTRQWEIKVTQVKCGRHK